MKVLAFTSGKGGVGKTTLALNAARELSLHGLRTLIIDFDIHNKGVTSLFMDKVTDSSPSVASIARKGQGFRLDLAAQVAAETKPIELDRKGKLYLIPASRAREKLDWNWLVAENDDIVAFLRSFLADVASAYEFDVVILDCYGGIDSLTVASAGVADDIIIVNEPDIVTYSGTLLLYSYIEDKYEDSQYTPRVHFIINRITSRHSFFFLQREYQKHLSELALTKSILAYLPRDELMARTFGDYPFFTELLPKSLITKKIRLMLRNLLDDEKGRSIIELSARQERKVYQATSEMAFAEPAHIIRSAASAPIWLLLPAALLFALSFGLGGDELPYDVIRTAFYTSCVVIVLIILYWGVFLPFQISRWLLRAARYRLRRAMVGGELGASGSWTSLLEFPRAVLPALFGVAFMGGIATVAMETVDDWLPLRNVSIWPSAISGFKAGGNYAGVRTRSFAQIESEDLQGTDFSNASLYGARLEDARLNGADLTAAEISYASLAGATLDSVSMRYASVRFTDFSDASLRWADFTGARIRNVNFRGADLTGAILTDADLSVDGFLPPKLEQVNFSGANLEGTEFAGSWLAGADLSMANLQNASFVGSDMTDVTATGAVLRGANLKGATLRNAKLQETDLSGSNLSFVDFDGADLTGARIFEARLLQAKLSLSLGLTDEGLSYAKGEKALLSDEQTRAALAWEVTNPPRQAPRSAPDLQTIDRLIASERRNLGLTPLADRHNPSAENLVEYLLIRNQPGDLEQVTALLDGLGRATVMEASAHGEGIYRLLSLMMRIVSEADDLQAGREWSRLVQQDSSQSGLQNWLWATWDEWFPTHRYSPEQNRKIRFVQLTAMGRQSADILSEWYTTGQ